MSCEKLELLASHIRKLFQNDASIDITKNQDVFYLYLASILDYNVNQGGFSQLIYNANGIYLDDFEDLLVFLKANRTLSFYRKAISACHNSLEEYSKFMESDYLAENELKHSLQLLSIEYLSEGSQFADEAEEMLSTIIPKVERWIEFAR